MSSSFLIAFFVAVAASCAPDGLWVMSFSVTFAGCSDSLLFFDHASMSAHGLFSAHVTRIILDHQYVRFRRQGCVIFFTALIPINRILDSFGCSRGTQNAIEFVQLTVHWCQSLWFSFYNRFVLFVVYRFSILCRVCTCACGWGYPDNFHNAIHTVFDCADLLDSDAYGLCSLNQQRGSFK